MESTIFKNIMIATDGSEEVRTAVDFALKLQSYAMQSCMLYMSLHWVVIQ